MKRRIITYLLYSPCRLSCFCGEWRSVGGEDQDLYQKLSVSSSDKISLENQFGEMKSQPGIKTKYVWM
jgi:hypothetical protein